MKLLVLGIDGLDKFILDGVPMPYLQSLCKESVSFTAELDLFSRGWPEILCGKHGRESGAFYNRPIFNKTVSFSFSFNTHSYGQNSELVPLWEALNSKGNRVGIMNVPTTMPAPEVDGFFVSGGGGGFKQEEEDSISPDACYPRDIANDLNKIGYIQDVRLIDSGIRDLDLFFDRLEVMQEKHTEGFISLSGKYSVDFGFLNFASVKDANYLAYADLEALIQGDGRPGNRTQQRLLQLYKKFDDLLRTMVDKLCPESVIVVSDHGMAPYKYNVNLNNFLVSHGWQKQTKSSVSFVKRLVKSFKQCLPAEFRQLLLKAVPVARALTVKSNADYSSTQAFGAEFIPGIYINDERFCSVVSNHERDSLVKEIVEQFNSCLEVKQLGMNARPYRVHYELTPAEIFLPDIWIDTPGSIQFKYLGSFICPNPLYQAIETLAGIDSDNVSGMKGPSPLIYVKTSSSVQLDSIDKPFQDLTPVYSIIERIMKR